MKLTVSIVTYHTDSDELRRCLASLTSPAIGRIIIIDNGAEPRIGAIAAREGSRVEYHASANVGYGAAHNRAIRRAMELGADYHLVLNSDVCFEPQVIDRLLDVLDRRPEVGQLQPRVVYPDGRLQYTVRLLPTPLDVFARRFLPGCLFRGRNDRYTLKVLDHSREMNPPSHQGSFMLLRMSSLHDVGLFDERYFMYPEDIDLTRRMHRRYTTLYYPAETIVHDHRAGSYHSLRLLWIHCVNMIRYFNKWGWFIDRERREVNRRLLRENSQ